MGMGGSDGCRNDTLLIVMELKYMYIFIYIYTLAESYMSITDFTYRFQGYGTTIRSDISSPSTSVNNPRLAIYGCMCVGVHTWTHT